MLIGKGKLVEAMWEEKNLKPACALLASLILLSLNKTSRPLIPTRYVVEQYRGAGGGGGGGVEFSIFV